MDKKLSLTAANLCIKTVKKVLDAIDIAIAGTSFSRFKTWKKEDGSYVTSIDLKLQSRIIEIIKTTFPSHNMLYEEGQVTLTDKLSSKSSSYTWVIDPIDGTNNMVQGKNQFASSVGLMHRDRFIGAIVSFPKYGKSYIALEGDGVYKNGREYVIPGKNDKNENKEIILCSKSYKPMKDLFLSGGYRVACYTCATFSMLKLLEGEAALYHTINTKIYDVGPMSFILKKCGIECRDRTFSSIDFQPDLAPIPFFLAARNETWINEKWIKKYFL